MLKVFNSEIYMVWMFQAIHVTNNMSEAARQAQEEAEIRVREVGLKWQFFA